MNTTIAQHTTDIFQQLFDNMPPLVPEQIVKDMQHALSHMNDNVDLTADQTEDMLIVFGKQIWPYRMAFQEFYTSVEGRIGEKFLIGKLSTEMKHKYKKYKEQGGSFRDLHTGRDISYFTSEERRELCDALIAMTTEITRHARQSVCSTDRRKYEERIVEFQLILDDIHKRLDNLHVLAENEQEHPQLADEIRTQIKDFEYGICALAPSISYDAVCNSHDFFTGRKKDLAR